MWNSTHRQASTASTATRAIRDNMEASSYRNKSNQGKHGSQYLPHQEQSEKTWKPVLTATRAIIENMEASTYRIKSNQRKHGNQFLSQQEQSGKT